MMTLRAQMVGEVLLERYRYGPGPAGQGTMHVHERWQWCLYVGGPGSYATRAGRTVFPSGTLTVMAPGEAHATQDPDDRRRRSVCLVAYLPPDWAPVHRGLVVESVASRRAFARLWPARDRLQADVALAEFLATARSRREPPEPAFKAMPAVRVAREYLHEHATEPVKLEQLADVAGLSSAHLVRAFGRAYGLPPHRYQTALRIDRTKRLLAVGGTTIGEVAHEAGFADHAHFTRTFRRWVGCPPSGYAKIVQDTGSRAWLDHRS
jgi:AraC-like DNA-binding protein